MVNHAIEQPAHGQQRTSNELRKWGIFVSGSGVRSIWLRHNLENLKKRLKALEVEVNSDGIILSDAQVAALEKKKQDDEAWVKLRQHTLVIWAPRTPSTLAVSRGWVVFTIRHLWTPTAKWLFASFIPPRRRLLRRMYSMTECCRSLRIRICPCFAY